MYFPVLRSTDHADCIPETPRQFDSLPWEPTRPQDKTCFWERIEAPLPLLRPRPKYNCIHPRQLSPFPERLELPFSNDEILCGCEDIVSSGSDHFTAWVKVSPHEVLVQHMVDIRRATADFAKHQKGDLLQLLIQTVSTNILLPDQLCRRDSASTTGTLGPDEEKKMPSNNRWRIITLQEASEYVDHDILTGRFHVTHYAGCAIPINTDTFYPNIDVKSACLHDTRRDLPDQVMEGEQGWVMQGVLSLASFRRSPVSGQKPFTVLSLDISNIYAKKKGIAKKLILTLRAIMISQEVDLVAGDFNGTAWRCRSRNNVSTTDEAFTDCALPTPPGPTPLWGPGSIPDNWADVCGFFNPLGYHRFWKVHNHGALSIPRTTLGLRPTDQSCHHETWLHLDFVDWSNKWSKQDDYGRHISLKERPADCSHGTQKRRISEVMRDHSL